MKIPAKPLACLVFALAALIARAQSGGTVTINGGYVIHTFYGNGTFTTSSPLTVDAIIVAGGGGGGAEHAGGGGAGGALVLNGISVNGSSAITVGAGGAGGTSSSWHGTKGGDSTAFGYTALGGGYGSNVYGGAASSGGSGGGYGYNNPMLGAAGTAGQGYSGNTASTGSTLHGGGGGGAGGAGNGIVGGAALNTWAGTFAGGGGGGFAGGAGGGAGAGAGGNGTAPGGNATNNTGSGGGGGGNMSNPGGSGGSGIVVIRYPLTRTLTLTPPSAPVYPGQNASFTVTASTTAPDNEKVGFLHIDVSTNGGSTWSGYSYDGGNDPALGKAFTKTVNVTAGAAGSVVKVRARAAYRFGAAGDVDYTGAAINWGGSWGNWQTPPTKDVSITVATMVKSDQTGVAGSLGAGSVTFPATTTVTASGGQSAGAYEVRQNGGTGAVSFSGSGTTRTITSTTAGTAAIEVRKLGDSSYNDSGWVSAGTLTINQGTQAALTAMANPSPQNFPFTVALSTSGGSGGGSVTYAIVSGPGTISGSTLTPIAPGVVVFNATKAADVNYNAITSANTSITINPGTQTGVGGSLGVSSVTFPNTTTVTASGGQSSGAYEFRLNGGTGAVSFSGSGASRTLTATTAGTAVIEVRKLSDGNYGDSSWVSAGTLTINQATQTGVAGSLGAGSVTFPNTTTVTASGGQSSGAYEFRQNGGTGAVTFSGSGTSRTISPTTAGTAVIEIRKLGNVNYTDSAWVGAGTLTIDKAIQAPLSASATPSTLAFGTSAALSSSGGTGSGAVTYAVVSGPATISGSTLTPTGVGTVVFTATKVADANYKAITSAGANVVINPGAQTGVGGSLSVSSVYLSGTATVTASGGQSSGAYEFRQSGGTGSVSFFGSGASRTIAPVTVGTAPIEVRRLGDGNYTDSNWVSAGTLTISAAPLATGGTITTSGSYTIHTFTSGGSFMVNSALTADVVIVAGGGGGGAQHAGGGGAGGMVAQNGVALAAGNYPITIGAGGNGCPAYGTYSGWSGQNGGSSTAFGQTAIGGGAGGGMNGNNGGCGGGANGSAVNGAAGIGGTGSQGGNGGFNATDGVAGGGGGGLAGSANASSGGSAITNWAGTFGGGGGGGFVTTDGHGALGGGAGAGTGGPGGAAGGNALPNTGSGGGGGGNNSAAGGNGGSGIVIIRYLTVQKQDQPPVFVSGSAVSASVGGSLVFTASGGSGAGSYVWGGTAGASGAGTSKTLTFNAAGTYSVTVYREGDATYNPSNMATMTVAVYAPEAYSTVWKPAATVGSSAPPTTTADGIWSYRYDTIPLDALCHPASSSWSATASESYLTKLATQTVSLPAAWWDSGTNSWDSGGPEASALIMSSTGTDVVMKSKAPTVATVPYALNTDGANPVLAFRAPLAGTKTYCVKADIAKSGGANAQSFGDGVLVEVYQVQHSNSNRVVRLWSSLLARADANALAKVNLLTELAFGDEVFFRVSSQTTNGEDDMVTLKPSVELALIERFPVAQSSGASDSRTDAINDAITAAAAWLTADTQRDRAIVELSGTYYLGEPTGEHPNPRSAYLGFSGRSNLTLCGTGAGASLIAKDFKRGFLRVDGNSTSVSVENVVFDYEESALPFIQGRVKSTWNLSNPVEATLDWLPNSSGDFTGDLGLFSEVFDPNAADPVRVKPGASATFWPNTVTINSANKTLTFIADAGVVQNVAPGDVVVLRRIIPEDGGGSEATIGFFNTTDCGLRNVTIKAAMNLTVMAKDCNGLHLDGVTVARSKTFVNGIWTGTDRSMSGSKDGVHFQGSRRGPTIENCSFDGLGDDGVNVHAQLDSSITELNVSAGTFKVSYPWANAIRQGDVLLMSSITTVTSTYIKPTYVVVSQAPDPTDFDAYNNPTKLKLTVSVVGSGSLQSDANRCTNLSSSAEGYIVRNSRFSHIRGRGGLMQAGFGLLVENHYDSITDLGLSFETFLATRDMNQFHEGPYPRDVVTRFNYFGTGTGYASQGLKIRLFADMAGSLKPDANTWVDAPMFQNVANQIRNNSGLTSTTVFIYWPLPGWVSDVNGIPGNNPDMNQN